MAALRPAKPLLQACTNANTARGSPFHTRCEAAIGRGAKRSPTERVRERGRRGLSRAQRVAAMVFLLLELAVETYLPAMAPAKPLMQAWTHGTTVRGSPLNVWCEAAIGRGAKRSPTERIRVRG